MTADAPRVLVVGYGNPGRRDDGLGPAAVEGLEDDDLPGVTVDVDYQLTVEHAAMVAAHDVAILVDAAVDGPEPFRFERLEPGPTETFSTHAVEPSAVAGLAVELFGARTEIWVLAIPGRDFEGFEERLSERATRNLAAARAFLRTVLATRDFAGGAASLRRRSTSDASSAKGERSCATART
jgi:hydrogenase maturation protease